MGRNRGKWGGINWPIPFLFSRESNIHVPHNQSLPSTINLHPSVNNRNLTCATLTKVHSAFFIPSRITRSHSRNGHCRRGAVLSNLVKINTNCNAIKDITLGLSLCWLNARSLKNKSVNFVEYVTHAK